MKLNRNNPLSVISRLVTAGFLLLGLFRLPYGYFTFLRLIVCAVAIYHVIIAYNLKRVIIVAYFGFIAILFNPIFPVYLTKQIWRPIDFVAAILFLLSFFFLRSAKNEGPAKDKPIKSAN
jgi:FtsH-binding integral membrane protein